MTEPDSTWALLSSPSLEYPIPTAALRSAETVVGVEPHVSSWENSHYPFRLSETQEPASSPHRCFDCRGRYPSSPIAATSPGQPGGCPCESGEDGPHLQNECTCKTPKPPYIIEPPSTLNNTHIPPTSTSDQPDVLATRPIATTYSSATSAWSTLHSPHLTPPMPIHTHLRLGISDRSYSDAGQSHELHSRSMTSRINSTDLPSVASLRTKASFAHNMTDRIAFLENLSSATEIHATFYSSSRTPAIQAGTALRPELTPVRRTIDTIRPRTTADVLLHLPCQCQLNPGMLGGRICWVELRCSRLQLKGHEGFDRFARRIARLWGGAHCFLNLTDCDYIKWNIEAFASDADYLLVEAHVGHIERKHSWSVAKWILTCDQCECLKNVARRISGLFEYKTLSQNSNSALAHLMKMCGLRAPFSWQVDGHQNDLTADNEFDDRDIRFHGTPAYEDNGSPSQ